MVHRRPTTTQETESPGRASPVSNSEQALRPDGRGRGAPLTLYGSADAVAAQALRRIGADAAPGAEPTEPTGGLTVILSGRPATLPAAALAYAEGRELAVEPAPVVP